MPEYREYIVRVSPYTPLPAAIAAAVATHILPQNATDHSIDFASVQWFGTRYQFSETQRSIIAVLWNAWERGTPDVHGRTLLREADSYAEDLRDVFRGNPAWDRFVRRSSKCGGPAGCFRLAEPVDAPPSVRIAPDTKREANHAIAH